jgi:transitional endoplasmic reticulum ATPase
MGYADSGATERVISQLLTEMDGIEALQNVVVIAATNRPDIIDPAALRPGRFDRLIYVPGPDERTRLQILKIHTSGVPLAKDIGLEELARRTIGCSGADLQALCREAGMIALRHNIEAKEVSLKDFEEAMDKVKPSLSPDMENAYLGFSKRFKKERAAVSITA